MSSGLLFLMPLLAVAATTLVVLLTVPRRRSLVAMDKAAFPRLARLHRSMLLARLAGILLGLAVIVPVATSGRLGRGLMLVPAVFAAVQILAVLTGDVIARHDARTPGSAGIEVRRVRDFLPAGLTRLTTLAAAALTVLLAWATVVASPDDVGRPGRSLAYTCTEDCSSGRLGPWPGSFYSVPMALALLAVVVLGGTAVLGTVRRPRNGSDSEIVRVDDAVRRRSVESVVASMGIAVSASLAGVGVFAGFGLAAENRAPVDLRMVGWFALGGGLASLVLLVWCLVILLLPGGRAADGRLAVPLEGPHAPGARSQLRNTGRPGSHP